MRILGIETSCDETSVSVLDGPWDIRSNAVATQSDLHAAFGGVVPEIASRRHVELILPIITDALHQAGVDLAQIEGVAVTNRPGLVGSLLVGVAAAKALAYARGLPLVGIHHLEGHIFASFLSEKQVLAPSVALIASGGHTEIFLVRAPHDYELMGTRLDDAAGEAFDKGARLLGLPQPGGPSIELLARGGDPSAVPFPRARTRNPLDFSFSGLKTALVRYIDQRTETSSADIAASYQQAIVDSLVLATLRAAKIAGVRHILAGGGVAANGRLKSCLTDQAAMQGIEVSFPPLPLCTDNAAMIAAAGNSRLSLGQRDDLDLDTLARSPLTEKRWLQTQD